MKRINLFAFCVFFLTSCSTDTTNGPWFGDGVHNGWTDQQSTVIWTRLTAVPDWIKEGPDFIPLKGKDVRYLDSLANADSIHAAQIPEGYELDDMFGACPGMPGEVRLRYYPDGLPDQFMETPWVAVDVSKNFTHQWKLTNLTSNTEYHYTVQSRKNPTNQIFATIEGCFQTAPDSQSLIPVDFCVVTCHDFNRRDDSLNGHHIYPAMEALDPDFLIHTGDVEYYDKRNPWAMTEALMRYKWDRLFALPWQRDFYLKHTTYWMKDDHDVLRDDCHPGDRYGTVSFERGLEIFDQEQFPSNPLPYKTIRWGKDVQIWLMEGRNFRTNNHQPDGPDKTIWGQEQKDWLFQTLGASDASFKIVVSPGPILGPDRLNKNDNYSNRGYQTEGDEIREFLDQFKNVYLVNGDRHWQYVTHPENSNLWEFSCGAGSDVHAGGWNPDDKRPQHRFLRVKGGFLSIHIHRVDGTPQIEFTHHDVDGKIVHREIFPE